MRSNPPLPTLTLRRLPRGDCGPETSAKLRTLLRKIKRLKGEDCWPLWGSVLVERKGERVRVYKQEALFNVDDYKCVVDYHKARGVYHAKMANGYARRPRRRLRAQLRLSYPGLEAEQPRGGKGGGTTN